jgi:uncharacterized protein (TIGR02569 family)
VQLDGGRGSAWRAGGIVVKPADADEEDLAWQAETFPGIRPEGLRLSVPRRARAGTFVVDGWVASAFCAGSHERGRWLDIIAVGERFHAALAGVACPDFVQARHDRWSIADRVAWGEAPLEPYLGAPHVAHLAGLLVPVSASPQVIHGDLTGNVLFADPLPPAVIDMSTYWRPAAYASAIVVADALAWEGATPADTLPATLADDLGQLLARAILFRIVADWLVDQDPGGVRTAAYARAVDLAVAAMEV